MTDGRRRRATDEEEDDSLEGNGFVTVCEGRFIPAPATPDTLILVWACPDGVAAPGGNDEEAICELLIDQRLVTSCTSPQGGRVDLPPPRFIPPTAYVYMYMYMYYCPIVW